MEKNMNANSSGRAFIDQLKYPPHLILNTAVTKVQNANSSAKEDWKGYQCVLRFKIIFGSHNGSLSVNQMCIYHKTVHKKCKREFFSNRRLKEL